ncbi:hypothetical protein KK471_30270, partial [Klebsiella pneumoniae]|uniref:hypothetical protein n=1 Tax=Klebsiella pneumoniae TaxID=573 RepID=UPI001BE07586
MATSASPTKRSNDTALKGLKLPVAGRNLKTQASRIAAIRASNIYQAVTEGRLNNNIASLNKNDPKVSPGNIALADLCNTRLSGFNP